jgi:hypothetical protein
LRHEAFVNSEEVVRVVRAQAAQLQDVGHRFGGDVWIERQFQVAEGRLQHKSLVRQAW